MTKVLSNTIQIKPIQCTVYDTHIFKVLKKLGKPRFYEQQERMRIESSQADMRASKAAMGADLDIGGEVWRKSIDKS